MAAKLDRYSIVHEPAGATYRGLLAFCKSVGDTVLLAVRDPDDITQPNQVVLRTLEPFFLSAADENRWPGTKLGGHNTARVFRYRFTDQCREVLCTSANRLYEWRAWTHPEEAHALRSCEIRLRLRKLKRGPPEPTTTLARLGAPALPDDSFCPMGLRRRPFEQLWRLGRNLDRRFGWNWPGARFRRRGRNWHRRCCGCTIEFGRIGWRIQRNRGQWPQRRCGRTVKFGFINWRLRRNRGHWRQRCGGSCVEFRLAG
jgi:hypothetical protein